MNLKPLFNRICQGFFLKEDGETPTPNTAKQMKTSPIFKILIRWRGGGATLHFDLYAFPYIFIYVCSNMCDRRQFFQNCFPSLYYAAPHPWWCSVGAWRVICRLYMYTVMKWSIFNSLIVKNINAIFLIKC